MNRRFHAPALLALVLSFASACGGGDAPADTSGGEVVSDTCAGHSQAEPCMNPDNFAQCQQLEAQCPGAVQVMESCPLQFSCP